VRARGKQVVAGKSKRIRSMSRLMPQKDDDPRQLTRPATRSRSSEYQGKTTHMNSNPKSGQISHSTPGHVELEHVVPDGLSEEMSNLRRDVASLKDTFARLASQAGGEVAKTVRGMSQTVASQVGSATSGVTDAGSSLPPRPRSTQRRSRPGSRAWRGAIPWSRLRVRCWSVPSLG
jgi:hypothetical protein